MNHRVSIDDFKKLKQLDRIEYLLRAEHLESVKPKSQALGFFNQMVNTLILVMFGIGMLIIIYLLSPSESIIQGIADLLLLTSIALKIFVFLIFVSILIWVILYQKWKKARSDLVSDFFEVNPKAQTTNFIKRKGLFKK